MTDAYKLKEIIDKGFKNGWKPARHGIDVLEYGKLYPRSRVVRANPQLNTILFDHDFAKYYFGEEDYTDGKITFANWKAWKYHLQQCVISEKPIDYYYKFIKK